MSFADRLQQLWRESKSSPDRPPECKRGCHCGVLQLDDEMFRSVGDDKVGEWVRSHYSQSLAHYVTNGIPALRRRGYLHVNFASEIDLVQAMEQSTCSRLGGRLVRCHVYVGTSVCGMAVNSFPESVQLRVRMGEREQKEAKTNRMDVARVVQEVCGTEVLIDHLNVSNYPGRVVANVRFHRKADAIKLVMSDKRLRLWGRSVEVDARNLPEMVKCHHCMGRGHMASTCPERRRVRIRFEFRQRVYESWRREMEGELTRSNGVEQLYVGMVSRPCQPPHCLVHAVFRDEQQAESGVMVMAQLYKSMLVCAPAVVDMSYLRSACFICGMAGHQAAQCRQQGGSYADRVADQVTLQVRSGPAASWARVASGAVNGINSGASQSVSSNGGVASTQSVSTGAGDNTSIRLGDSEPISGSSAPVRVHSALPSLAQSSSSQLGDPQRHDSGWVSTRVVIGPCASTSSAVVSSTSQSVPKSAIKHAGFTSLTQADRRSRSESRRSTRSGSESVGPPPTDIVSRSTSHSSSSTSSSTSSSSHVLPSEPVSRTDVPPSSLSRLAPATPKPSRGILSLSQPSGSRFAVLSVTSE